MPNYNYFPGTYSLPVANSYGYMNPSYGVQMPTSPIEQNQVTNSVVWVQGEAGANAYPVARGQTIMLMDANPNSNMFYIKSADPYSGRPMPLEKYHYTRIIENGQNEQLSSAGVDSNGASNAYVPREEFNSLKEQIDKLQKTLDGLTE